ncbi:MAG: DUF4041 domain-containing protein [Clostridiales bacterium]|nr:DUF4041 domain-containing protein [Clostridiales bacterium]
MLKDLLNIKKIKAQNQIMKEVIGEDNLDKIIDIEEIINSKTEELSVLEKNIKKQEGKLDILLHTIKLKKAEIIEVDEELLMESFSLYCPKYDFDNSDFFKEKLTKNRDKQKQMIKEKIAATGNQNWTVNGKKSEGKKMVNDMLKLLLRSFNNECDASVKNIKFNNVESCEKRIEKSYDTINKLGRVMNITINSKYKKLKYEELYLAHEYKLKKQEEKEEQKRLREEIREEAKLAKEIEESRKEINKEKKHYSKALTALLKQIEGCDSDDKKLELEKKIEEVELQLNDIEKNLKDIDYREANKRAGYVYVISNIGSFGEGVYKIGMTRRLEPLDRVHELGDASVPFNFDVHAMIFSDDAPTLENKLHKAFDKSKINKINTRREFFKVNLKDIERVIKENHDKTVEFSSIPLAEQYRESKKIGENVN